jgi:hypothetical protein
VYGTFAEVKKKKRSLKKKNCFYLLVVLDGRPARSNFYTTSYISLILVLTATTGHERTKLRKSPKRKNRDKRFIYQKLPFLQQQQQQPLMER